MVGTKKDVDMANQIIPTETVAVMLKRYRERARWTKVKLAEKLGLSSGSVSGWETGRKIPMPERITQIAKLLNLSLEEIHRLRARAAYERMEEDGRQMVERVQLEGTPVNHDQPQPELHAVLPLYGDIPAGPPAAVDQAEEVYAVLQHLAKRNRYVLRVKGESMSDRLHDGDLVVVEYVEEANPAKYENKACVVLLDGQSMLKFVEITQADRDVTVVTLKGGKGDYPSTTFVLGKRDFRIQGVVVELVSRKM